LYPLWFLLSAWLIDAATSRVSGRLPIVIAIVLAAVQFTCAFTFRNNLDGNLGYADRVRVQSDAIHWMLGNGMKEKNIYAVFLMANNLRDKAPGYVKQDEVFPNVSTSVSEKTELLIATDVEPFEGEVNKIPKKLINRWERKGAWVEIWEYTH
jgi:hypothetical protein